MTNQIARQSIRQVAATGILLLLLLPTMIAQKNPSQLSIGINTSHVVSPKLEVLYTRSLKGRLAAYVTGATGYEEARHYAASTGVLYQYPLGKRLTFSAGLGMRLNYFRSPGFAEDGSARATQFSIEAPVGMTYNLSDRIFLHVDYLPYQTLSHNISQRTINGEWTGIRVHAGCRF